MKKNDLKPGTKVLASVNDEEWGDHEIIPYVHGNKYITLAGVVLDKVASKGHVFVQFDDDNDWGYEEVEVEIKLLTLASELPSIEADFKFYQKQIEEKMKEAAKLVNEAGKLAEKAHVKSLESLQYSACRSLVDAMDANGWRSSSWGC